MHVHAYVSFSMWMCNCGDGCQKNKDSPWSRAPRTIPIHLQPCTLYSLYKFCEAALQPGRGGGKKFHLNDGLEPKWHIMHLDQTLSSAGLSLKYVMLTNVQYDTSIHIYIYEWVPTPRPIMMRQSKLLHPQNCSFQQLWLCRHSNPNPPTIVLQHVLDNARARVCFFFYVNV